MRILDQVLAGQQSSRLDNKLVHENSHYIYTVASLILHPVTGRSVRGRGTMLVRSWTVVTGDKLVRENISVSLIIFMLALF